MIQIPSKIKNEHSGKWLIFVPVFVIVLIILIGSSILAGFFKKKDDSKEK